MNCMAIKLQDRRNASARSRKQSDLDTVILFSDEFHRYEFRYDKPVRPSKEPNPVISEINLNFPENYKTPHSATTNRWIQKRPRLKSTKRSKHPTCAPLDTPINSSRSEDELTGSSIIEEIKNEQIPNIMEASEMFGDACEVDPDIQKLILECENAQNDTPPPKETHKKKRKKHSGKGRLKGDDKKGNGQSKKVIKTVAMSISKPPSPQTVQVIRVDVISNYSTEQEQQNVNLSTCKTTVESSERNSRVLKTPEALYKMQCQDGVDDDLEIKCMRVTLSERL